MPGKQHAPWVLLINPNRMKPAVGPLGLELIAENLARKGFRSKILDLTWEKSPARAIRMVLRRDRPLAAGMTVRNLDDCYLASQAFLLPPLRFYIRTIRESSGVPVIVGGVGFSISPSAALSFLGADFGLCGDGEESLPALLEKLRLGKTPGGIAGLVRPGHPDPPPAIVPIRESPCPRRDSLDLRRYFRLGGQGNLETQRGCNRKCIYCADPVTKGPPRFREPAAVVEEMERLLRLGVHTLHFCDSEFNLSRKHAAAVCREIIAAGLGEKIQWYVYAAPSPFDHDLARLMSQAGCRGIDFGVDAGNEEMLQNLGRDFSVEQLEICAAACRQNQIACMFDLLLGGPGETTRTLTETIRRMKKIRPDRVGVSFGVRVFAGTPLARNLQAEGPLEQNPALIGAVRENPGLLRPLFYLSPRLGKNPERRLAELINHDPRFFFASREELINYNYNNNRPLTAAIRKGARGAYWDILRKMALPKE